ncbi:MAG: hypothetical protein LBQ23_00010 [Puniceicoccales bacterium]|nr:hypothetical protein [Puniceicoccales bacterium]
MASWQELSRKYPEKIQSEKIGAIVIYLPRASEPVVYLGFASVYKKFETVKDFALEFEQLSLDLPK